MEPKAAGAIAWRVGLNLLALAALVLVLWRGASFVRLLLVALVLAAALEEPVRALERRHWRRGLAIAAVSLLVVGGLVAAVALLVPRVGPQLQEAVRGAPDAVSRLRESSEMRWLQEHQALERAASALRRNVGTAAGAVASAALGLASLAGGIVTAAAVTAFLLVSGPTAWSWALRWIHPARRGRARRLGGAVRHAVAGYVGGALAMGAIAATVTGVTTGLLGVPFFLALALVTFVLGIVPFVGAIVSAVVVVVTTFVTVGGASAAVALIVFVVYQQLEGAVLQPLVQRRTIEMNPLLVISAVLLGIAAAGVFGGVIALPIAAAGKVVAADVLKRRRRAWRAAGRPGERPRLPAAPPPH